MQLFETKYTIRKVLHDTPAYACYLAQPHTDDTKVVLVNVLRERTLIDRYIALTIDLKQQEMPEFIEFFSGDSQFYIVFAYVQGETLENRLCRVPLSFLERLLLWKRIIYQMTLYPEISCVWKTTALHAQNIICSADDIRFNFRFFDMEEDLTEKSKMYAQIYRLSQVIFKKQEIEKNADLRIVLDKCQKGVYRSFGEVLKDLEYVEASEEKERDARIILKEKKAKLYQKLRYGTVLLVAVALLSYGYQKWKESKKNEAVYVAQNGIGTVNVYETMQPEVIDITTITTPDTSAQTVFAQEESQNTQETTLQATPIQNIDTSAETEKTWLVDENGVRYQMYVVQKNEYLVEIAQAFYSDYSYNDVLRIAEYNDLQNMDVLHTGQEIKLPEK